MIETPEEFVCRIRDRYEDSFTMDWDDAEKEVLTRDAAIRAECAPKWISVKERLPEALERVLVFYVNDFGKNRIDIGQHIPPKTVLEEDFFDENTDGCSTYDEEHDCYWVNEGWWEDSWQAEVNYKIRDVVTHWQPLPEPPVGKEGEE